MSATATPPPYEVDDSTQHPVRRAALWITRGISFVIYVYLMLVEIILFLGFLLLLLGANPSSSFVEWVYRSMDRAMRPFRGIFEPIEIGVTQSDVPSVFETSVVFAMIVYGVIALVIHALIEWLKYRLIRLDREDEEHRRRQFVSQTMATQAQPPVTPAPLYVPMADSTGAASTAPTATPPAATPADTAPPAAPPADTTPPES